MRIKIQEKIRNKKNKLLMLLWLLFILILILMGQFTFIEGDDFLHVSFSNVPYGKFSFLDWIASWRSDYLTVNGRFADALLRLILRPGIQTTRIIISISLIALIYMLYHYMKISYTENLNIISKIYMSVLSVAALALTLFSHDYFYADVIGWYSGAANYLIPTVFVLVGFTASQNELHGRKTGILLYVVSTACLVIGQISHELIETISFTYFLSFVIYLKLQKKQLSKLQMIQICISMVTMVAHLLAPGIQHRMERYSSSGGDLNPSAVLQFIYNVANGGQHFIWTFKYFLIVLSAVLIGLLWRRSQADRSIRVQIIKKILVLIISLISNLLLMLLRRVNYIHLIAYQKDLVYTLMTIGIALVSILFLLLYSAIVIGTVCTDPTPEIRKSILWFFAVVGSMVIPLLLGMQNVRGLFPAAVFFSVFMLNLLSCILWQKQHNRIMLNSCLVIVILFSIVVYSTTIYKAAQNKSVWDNIEDQLSNSRKNQTGSICVLETEEYPYSDLIYTYAYSKERYEESIRIYYSIPAYTSLTWTDN